MQDQKIFDIQKEYQTPLYVYDGEKIEKQYDSIKEFLPENFEIFFSMKANPLLGICQFLKKLGSKIEVASEGELYTALKAGFSSQDIIFTSPGKTYDELLYAIENDIYSINIESVDEANIIQQIAKEQRKTVNIAIRINPNFDVSGAKIKMSGVSTQFGIDQNDIDNAINEIKGLSNIKIIGIHIYNGTQMLNTESIINNLEQIFILAVDLFKKHNIDLEFLDLGGGFGIPYFKNESYLDLEILKEGISTLWNKYKSYFKKTRMAVESGRFILAESGQYITKVLYKKQCKGRTYLVCDGGSNHHANSAFLGRYIRNNFPMHILNKKDAEVDENKVTVVGPLCTPTDVIAQNINLPEAGVGDILVIEKSGAYGLTNSPAMFLSHCRPTEIMIYNNKTYLLRVKGDREDFLTGQKSFTV